MTLFKTTGHGLVAAATCALLAQPALADIITTASGAKAFSAYSKTPKAIGDGTASQMALIEEGTLNHIHYLWVSSPIPGEFPPHLKWLLGGTAKPIAPSDDFSLISSSMPGPAYAYTGFTFSSTELQADSEQLADQYAAQLAQSQALSATLPRYYGALAAGDPVAGPLETTLTAGLADGFAAPGEPAAPGPELLASSSCSGGEKGFDDSTTDRCFAHTFTDLPPGIAGGTLEIRLSAQGGSTNDAIALQALPGVWGWWRRIGLDGPVTGVLPVSWNPGMTETLVLDLGALPNADGTTTDLVPTLNADGRLDVYVQDDTSVDYVRVDLVYADPGQVGMTYSAIQLQHAAELVAELSAGEQAIADAIESLTQYPEFQNVTITAAEIAAFHADVEANGLPALELQIATEMGLTAAEIAILAELEVEIPFDPAGPDLSGIELLQAHVQALRLGELGVVASLPQEILSELQGDPVVCLGASITPGPGVGVSCGIGGPGIDIPTGSGGVITKPDPDTWGKPAGLLSPSQLNTFAWWGMTPGKSALVQASTDYQTGADAYPVTATATEVGANQFALRSDFSAMGVPSKTVQIWADGSFVAAAQVAVGDLDVLNSTLPTTLGPGYSTGAFAFGSTRPEWCWEWASPQLIELPQVGMVAGNRVVVSPDLGSPAPHWFFGEVALQVAGMTSFGIEAVDFGGSLSVCQPSLGYASDPAARISVCGGNLSAGTTAELELFGAPPFGTTLLFVGTQSNPTPLSVLGGASLVPLPYLLSQALSTDGNGAHSITLKGGHGPLTLTVQEVILSSLTVTNAVEIEFLQ